MNAELAPTALLALFERTLSDAERPVVAAACAWAHEHAAALFLVGGSTRDLLLGRPRLDLDLAVEGDAPALGRWLAARFAATATVHETFGTAVVEGNDWRIDLARTRVERYAYPGALPEVTPAGIRDDLARRDFAAHAVALRIVPAPADLLDPFDGVADIMRGMLRVLHAYSFTEDPTRILRLTRYAARLDWLIEATTDELARRDAPLLANIAAARVGHEIARTLEERGPEQALSLLGARYPAAARAAGMEPHALGQAPAVFTALRSYVALPKPEDYLATLSASGALRQDAGAALALGAAADAAVRDARRALAIASRLARPAHADPVQLVEELDRCSSTGVMGALAALSAGAADGWRGDGRFAAAMLARYLREWRALRPRLDGNELQALGVHRGPAIGRALSALRAARIRDEATTIEDERALLARLLAEGRL